MHRFTAVCLLVSSLALAAGCGGTPTHPLVTGAPSGGPSTGAAAPLPPPPPPRPN